MEEIGAMYVVGRPVSEANEWIRTCRLLVCEEQKMPVVMAEDGEKLESTGTLLGEGTYGQVYLYIGATKECAVKVNERAMKTEMFELGHPNFVDAEKRTQMPPVLMSAIFEVETMVQVMELGCGTCNDVAIDYDDREEMQNFTIKVLMGVLFNNLCYTDFKLTNVIAFRCEYGAHEFRLGDVDAIGCIMGREYKFMGNRIATYPVDGRQSLLGHPIVDMIQTWYSGVLNLIMYEIYRHQYTKRNRMMKRINRLLAHDCMKKRIVGEEEVDMERIRVGDFFNVKHPFFSVIAYECVEIKGAVKYLTDMAYFCVDRLKTVDCDIASRRGKDIEQVKTILIESLMSVF